MSASPALARAPFRRVFFDCDSTLCALEGIEALAVAHREEVAALTDAAMRGVIPLEEVYGRRLALVRPTRAEVEALGRRYVAALLPDAVECVAALRCAGVDVAVISGGLAPAVRAIAAPLGLDERAIAAVELSFDRRGDYAGFDAQSPLTRAGGKREVIARWDLSRRPLMLVGDGATDLEARDAVDLFVAFAGIIERPAVVAAADVVIRARSLAPVVTLALGAQPPRDPRARVVYERGRALLDAPHTASLTGDG